MLTGRSMRWLRHWLDKKPKFPFASAHRPARFRPCIELLESRQLLASLAAPSPIAAAGSITNAEPLFSWNTVAGADHYDVWVDDQTSGQTAVLRNQAVSGITWLASAPLRTGDRYSWQVRAIDATGTVVSPWSQ